jgi:hypothetical protein
MRPAYIRNMIAKDFQSFAAFYIFEEGLHWDARAREYGRAAKPAGVGCDERIGKHHLS